MNAGTVLRGRLVAWYVSVFSVMWLALSVYVLPYTGEQFANSSLVALLGMFFIALAVAWPRALWMNAVLGVWLAVSATFGPEQSHTTVMNHIVTGGVMAISSMLGASAAVTTGRDPLRPRRDSWGGAY